MFVECLNGMEIVKYCESEEESIRTLQCGDRIVPIVPIVPMNELNQVNFNTFVFNYIEDINQFIRENANKNNCF